MKKYIVIVIAFICALNCKAQSVTNKDSISRQKAFGEPGIGEASNLQNDSNAIYSSVEQIPTFPGGMQSFNLFLKKNLKWPVGEEDVRGKVFLKFIVEKDGSLTDFVILRSPSFAFGNEAIHVMKKSPKWIPAKIKGQPVRCYYTIPVSFQMED